MASLGWVTPGAATEGVTPLFFLKNLTTFFAHRCHYHYRFLLLSLGCHPPQVCHPTPFLPVRFCFSTILCKFAHKKFISSECHPLEGCHPVQSAPPSDDTVGRYVGLCTNWFQQLQTSHDHIIIIIINNIFNVA